MRPRTLYRYGLYALLLLLLAAFLIWPIFLTVKGGFIEVIEDADGNVIGQSFTLQYVLDVFKSPVLVEGLFNSFLIAVFTTLLCLVISLPLAVLAVRYDFRGKAIITSLVLVPLILPPFVGAIGLKALLGRMGAVNEFLKSIGLLDPDLPGIDFLGGAVGGQMFSVVLMEALHLYPILYLNISAALANLDPSLDEAAVNLGAGRFKRFFRLTLPLILPGVFAGGTIVFIWSFTELGTPLMFDFYDVTPVQVFFRIAEIDSSPQPYALTVVMLGAALLMYALGKLAFGGKAYEMQSKATVGASATKLGPVPGALAAAAFTGVTLLAVLPHIGVVLTSVTVDGSWYRAVLPQELTLGHYEQALSHELATTSIYNSLVYALLAMFLAIAAGLAISYLVVRCKIKGGFLLDSLAMLPLAVPGLVMAFGYVAMSLSWPFPQLADWFEANGMSGLASLMQVRGDMPNPLAFLVVAYAVRRLPYIVRSASAGLEQTSGSLEEAALNLGASTATAIRRIVVPLILANLIAGGILVFAFSMLEVSDSLILAEKEEHAPITKAIYIFFSRLGDGPYIASAMGVWGMALLTITLVGASVLMGKRLGAIFRV